MSETAVPDVWYWVACGLFVITSGLIIYLIKRQDNRIDEIDDCVRKLKKSISGLEGLESGCTERHKAIAQALTSGRERFSLIEKDIKELLKGDN